LIINKLQRQKIRFSSFSSGLLTEVSVIRNFAPPKFRKFCPTRPGLRASAPSGRAASKSFFPLPLLYPSASDFQFRYAPVTVGSGRVGLT